MFKYSGQNTDPTLLDETSYRALNLKTWSSDTETKSACSVMVLQLFEDGNDGVKRGRETVKRTSRQRYGAFRMSKIQPDDENETGPVQSFNFRILPNSLLLGAFVFSF